MVKIMRKNIYIPYHDFTRGPLTKQLSSLIIHEIGAAIRSKVAMKALVCTELPQSRETRCKVHFNFSKSQDIFDFIENRDKSRYADWKYKLHKIYKEFGTNTPDEFKNRTDKWEWLVQHFESRKFKTRSDANTINRDKKDLNHHSSSTTVYYLIMEHMKKGSQMPLLDAYKNIYVRPREYKTILNTISNH